MRKNLFLIVLLSLMISFLGIRQESDKGERVLVFTHATIINTAGGPNKTDMTVVITGDRITDINETGKVRPPEGDSGNRCDGQISYSRALGHACALV